MLLRRFPSIATAAVLVFLVAGAAVNSANCLAAEEANRTAAAKSRPNIVLFLADDHGYLDSSVYGSRVVHTPNMDRLAAAGMTFTHAFVGSPSCAPSRAILYTGLMSARNGAEPNHSQIHRDVKTLPHYLSRLGYRVALFGKSHIGPRANYEPLEIVPDSVRRDPQTHLAGLDTAVVARWLQKRAASNERRPVCLFVCSFRPHIPWPAKNGYHPARVELPPTFVDTPKTRAARARYYADVTATDRLLGETYDAARRHLGKNTLFLYSSDHGAQWPFAKWNLYDAGIRVPLLASWPGKIRAGSRGTAMISFVDFAPTLIELAGGKPPKNFDGHSFAALLRGEKLDHREAIFATHSGDQKMNVYPMRCVRTRRFKYILNLHPEFEYSTHFNLGRARDGLQVWNSWLSAAKDDPRAASIVRRYHRRPREELYNLLADPHEITNLADRPRHRQELVRLRERLAQWTQQQGDRQKVFGTPRLLDKE